ncbi:Tox-REase-5 domain-containing protein [Streptomyces sp. NPDC093260]|uniref:Tox-REase-5 domain-containing protein n=1 Tax=Streptomyces sp. NPDC093260 TaxID=3155073 RepID=UPI00341206FD
MSWTADVGRRRRRRRRTLERATAGTAFAAAAAVLTSLLSVVPAAADTQEEDQPSLFRNPVGATVREDRCLAGVALHAGGAKMKAKAVEGLSGTADQLRAVVGDVGWIGLGPLGQASDEDHEAALDYRDELAARNSSLEEGNKPYASNAFYSDEMDWHIPEFDADVLQFTLSTQEKLAWRLGWDGHSNAGPEAVARAREITEENEGKNATNDFVAAWSFEDDDVYDTEYAGGTTAADIAAYLRYGGFPTQAPAEGSAAYRIMVEDLKKAWSECSWQNPLDGTRALNGPVATARAEWEQEYAGQAAQRNEIIQAEADAAAHTRAATDDMVQAIQQAWRADQILTWRKVVAEELADDPESLFKPAPELYEQADADLAAARAEVDRLAQSAGSHAAQASQASERAVTAQQEAWAIADAADVPRGRALMYAQQSVQVTRASAAAAQAAAEATATARDATDATVGDSRTLLSRAETETHALNTEFRRVAAQEAAAQAKAAADSAESNAQAAQKDAAAARSAESTAKAKQETARQQAATAQTQRVAAEMEYATATAARAEAAGERAKAAEAETRAGTQRTTANTAKETAATAADDAAQKRKTADEKAAAAQAAREKAVAAERGRQAAAARAAALEAAAAAAAGTASAQETRQAADQAQQASGKAAEAAATARSAADAATAAAVSARTAATKAEGAAARAQADAGSAWSAYLASTSAAATARATAATALDKAQDAALRARNAAAASDHAATLAKRAGDEAASAVVEAAKAVESAGVTAGRAYAVGQAALAARDSAAKAVAAATDAVALGTPYQETDGAAAFAVLTGQSAKTLAEQQAAAAAAKAAEAQRAAADAERLAEQAEGDKKLAAQAAAQAAADSVRATAAVTRAQTAAQSAAEAGEGAKQAADSAADQARQAGDDALSAQQTADDADSVAGAADREATDAERDALKAGESAGRAEKDAAEAHQKAGQAEQDAKRAEDRASDAQTDSTAAEEAAEQAEQKQRERNEEEHKKALQEGNYPIPGGPSSWPELTDQQEGILLAKCGRSCVDDYRVAYAAVSVDILEWTAANGGQILLDQLGVAAVKKCLTAADVDGCLWALVDLPASVAIVGRVPALAAAIEQVSTGIRQVFTDADDALRKLNELTALIGEVRSTPRRDRCVAGVALHAGGPEMKAEAIEALSGTDAELRESVGDIGWIGLEPLGQARSRDRQAAFDYRDRLKARETALEDANKPYAQSAFFSDDMDWHVPAFDQDVLQFTLFTQEQISSRLGWDGHSNASADSIARARQITEENRGKDSWYDWAADQMLKDGEVGNTHYSGGTTASDVASYLRHGGFLTEAPAEGSPEFRVEVENLKQAWATCDHQEPEDPRNKLAAVTAQAYTEWEAEYAGQAAPRAVIMQAEADASAETRAATDDMIEAIGQAWRAEQILTWQRVWHDTLAANPDDIFKPGQALYDKAKADLATARGKVSALTASAKAHSAAAAAAAQRAVDAQEDAWAIADAAEVPRGRGLMYAQQSVQVARASSAAAQAAAKATETTLEAATATVEDSKALLALAQTEAHALDTEFQRIAAEEAAHQAKVAADSADALAASAARHAANAKSAAATAAQAEAEAKSAAATAQAERANAERARAEAVAQKAVAESERAKAHEAEQRAQTERGNAAAAESAAAAAADTAADKRKTAERAEADARTARNKAYDAEQAQKAMEARAAALEAAAAAAEGTDAAGAARAAADEAWAAADTAQAAAIAAHNAADEATTAASNARAAATRAESAAARATASSEAAWDAWWVAFAAAQTAHAAAAEAIDEAEAAAGDATKAQQQAAVAEAASAQAQTRARAARASATATAESAAVTAGHALAAGNAAAAARDAATAVVRPADEAIALGTPYQETDVSAAFAVLTGQISKPIAEQQASAAAAKAAEAEAAATKAQALADGAAADARAATQAAADAAADTVRAQKAAQRALASAGEAHQYAEQAKKSDAAADQYATAAGEDAVYSTFAANEAQSAAYAADAAADEAEKDAASARTAAAEADGSAQRAHSDAVRADKDASAAETAAEHAQEYADEAASAADRTERASANQQVMDGSVAGLGGTFYVMDEDTLKVTDVQQDKPCELPPGFGTSCTVTFTYTLDVTVDYYLCTNPDVPATESGCPASDTLFLYSQPFKGLEKDVTQTFTQADILKGLLKTYLEIGKQILVQDFIDCRHGSLSGCAWAASNFIPGKAFEKIVEGIRALDAAMQTGVGVRDAYTALKGLDKIDPATLAKLEETVDAFEDFATACPVKPKAALSLRMASTSVSATAAGCWADLTGPGEWKAENENMSAAALAYQMRVTGTPKGMVYRLTADTKSGWVKFDGFKDGKLLDAKNGYLGFIDKKTGKFYTWWKAGLDEAKRQDKAFQRHGIPIVWHCSEAAVVPLFKEMLKKEGITSITVVYTP